MATVNTYTTPAPALPCNWAVDTGCCSTWDEYTTDLQTAAANFGALIVWAATGRRFGLCERTVRPCGQWRDNSWWGNGWYWSEGVWFPYIFNGLWRNCYNGCGAGCCTCEPTHQVWLPAPVASIPATGVSVDGEIIPTTAWRVDDGQWLVRTDGQAWPDCQDYDADSGEGVFTVTYNKGLAVPSTLLRAAGEMACEYAKACTGGECRLPSRIQSLTRQGMTVSMVDVDSLLDRGLTGVQTVDQVITTFNPYGLKKKLSIWSPDLPINRYTTQA